MAKTKPESTHDLVAALAAELRRSIVHVWVPDGLRLVCHCGVSIPIPPTEPEGPMMVASLQPPRERKLAPLADPTPGASVGVGAAVERVFASTGSGGAHLDDTTSGTAAWEPAAVNGGSPTAVAPFGGHDAPAVPGRWLERGAISHPAPARPARAVPQGVNDGKGLYICPGSRVVVRTEDQQWPGYVVGENGLGDLWVRHPDGYEVRVWWRQVVAAR